MRHPIARDEQADFEAWLKRDPHHPGVLLRSLAGLSIIDESLQSDHRFAPARSYRFPAITRRWMMAGTGGAIAATLAGMFGWSRLGGQYIATSRGEIRRLPLADGSVATINTSSELRIILASDNRRIELARGQAWFEVAKDRTRPFVVDAGVAQVRAVGTAFSVSRGADGVQVAVTEGTVAAWPSDSTGAMIILEAGQFANFSKDAASPTVGSAPAAIERTLAWRSGDISLENETLAEAVAQFNRYNRQQLVIDSPDLANERLVGLFKIDKPANFAAMVSASLDADVVESGDQIRLVRKN
nr:MULTISPECIES: FecR domain-containing protein [unclassified Sphingomonas]